MDKDTELQSAGMQAGDAELDIEGKAPADSDAQANGSETWATKDGVVVIPALDPDETLLEVIDGMAALGLRDIIVVDDGSQESCAPIFRRAQHRLGASVTLLRNEKNLGKGSAIKNALRYIEEHRSADAFVVTMDADGQHRAIDAKRVLMCARLHPEALAIGARTFASDVPLRSRLGNGATRVLFKLASGKSVSDTQTGLRAFSARQIPHLLDTPGSRYDFEMNMLLSYAKAGIAIEEVPIATIYHDRKNTCSHYNTLGDSLKICAGLLKFAGSSFLSFLVDYALFIPMTALFGGIVSAAAALVMANVSARVVSASFNYYLNSTYVFKSTQHRARSIAQYAALAACVLALNTAILFALTVGLDVPAAIAKIATELVLFVVSYIVQRFVIFVKRDGAATSGKDGGADGMRLLETRAGKKLEDMVHEA